MIKNEQFWKHWRAGDFEEALQCSTEETKAKSSDRLHTMLFGNNEQRKQTVAGSVISAGEFIYDYIMINPTVVKGIDFARSENLSSMFTLSQFASEIDTASITGDMAQLQGYVAEQMIATELQAKGHDVQFPETSNQAGWDMLVDGQPFQVKSLSGPAGVVEHLERYPDIPVYVNEELASHFTGHDRVYVSGVSREEVIAMTQSTLDHADQLLDFEIPWIAAGVSSYYNIKRVWKDGVTINQAVLNVVSDTSSRVVLGTLGQKAGVVAGTMLFGPAGGIAGALFGAFAGASQGARLSTAIRRRFSKEEEQKLAIALIELIQKVITIIEIKPEIKQSKLDYIEEYLTPSAANQAMLKQIKQRVGQEKSYILNKKEELLALIYSIQKRKFDLLEELPRVMAVVAKSGVHPFHYQQELKAVQQASKQYANKK